MISPAPNPQLLRSLGKLARGLSALFWGLPATLLISAETARSDWPKPLNFLPVVAANALILYGLWQMSEFQRQERPWRQALDRALLLATINLGLSPFVYWYNRVPDHVFFRYAIVVLAVSGVLLLFNLNLVLRRLGAMLPDETLRHETRQFTALNRGLLVFLMLLFCGLTALSRMRHLPPSLEILVLLLNRVSGWLLIFFALLPLAMTMALIWKTKEVILDAVFGPRH
jgi:hypothetical protein